MLNYLRLFIKSGWKVQILAFTVLLVMFWLLGGLNPAKAYLTGREVVVTISDKQRVNDADGRASRYMVWAKDGSAFENTDTVWWLKYNSSTVYGIMETGKSYRLHIVGFRVPFFSMYPNIISAKAEQGN